MIEFKGTGFTYDGDRFVLDGVDARIERGEFVCVLGGNGSGKSTRAKHINALLLPDEGEVRVSFDDSIITDTSAEKRQDMDEVAAGLMDAQEYRRKWHGESGQASRGGGSSQ